MANRAPALDPVVFCIRDLMREGSNRLSPEYRGKKKPWNPRPDTADRSSDYYNGGAMDMIT